CAAHPSRSRRQLVLRCDCPAKSETLASAARFLPSLQSAFILKSAGNQESNSEFQRSGLETSRVLTAELLCKRFARLETRSPIRCGTARSSKFRRSRSRSSRAQRPANKTGP